MDFLVEFFQQIVNGLSLGSIYALVALGYTMVYGIVRLINFAHGDILMIAAYMGFFTIAALGTSVWGFLAAFGLAMVGCAVFGITIEKLAYKPLRKAMKINTLITAIGVSFLIENGTRIILGANPKRFQRFNVATTDLFNTGVVVNTKQFLTFAVSLILMAILAWIINKTKMGKAMRAVSFDYDAASLMGINVNKTISFTFALGSALAGAGGVLFATSYTQINPYMGIMPGLKAFIAAVLGGIGSIPGAVAGGFILGIAETLTTGFVSSQLKDAISFAILIVILLVKPTGLMGEKIREKV
jgi:branched-chain amino acid transport system permease protein